MSAKISLENPAVFRPIENRTPRFQFAHAVRRFFRVQLSHPPIVYVLAAAHGVGKMDAPVIAIVYVSECRSNPPFGHDSVRLAEERLANYADAHAGCGSFNRSPQSRAAAADDKDIVRERFVSGHR